MALITDATPQALACCAGWLLGHARVSLSDADMKRAIFNYCFEFCCVDHAKIDLDKLLYLEAFIREAFAREGLRGPSAAQFFQFRIAR